MRIIHCISGLRQSGGGPSRSVPALVEAIALQGAVTSLMTVGTGNGQLPEARRTASILHCSPSPLGVLGRSIDMETRLLHEESADLFHGHGLWELPVHYMARAAEKRSRPYVIAPRGMLESWALKRSRMKKRVIGWLYQDRDLQRADCLHAVTPLEEKSFRAYGLENPIAVVPNGVHAGDFENLKDGAALFAERFPESRDRRVVLFLSRMHPKKNLPKLIDAWSRIHSGRSEWLLVVAGPDQGGHRAEIEERVKERELDAAVLFTGPLYGEMKAAALGRAEVFVLPSFSEGFSVAILEALAAGLPVVITPGCNFPEVARVGAGIVSEPMTDELAGALKQVLDAGDNERRRMGDAGRRLVEQQYTWEGIGRDMLEVYRWLTGAGRCPEHLVSR